MASGEEAQQRSLSELRVVDLKHELEKRQLDKSGVKAVLIDRLANALKDEGHDAETYTFEVFEKRMSTSRRQARVEPKDGEQEEQEHEPEVENDLVDGEEMEEFQVIDGGEDLDQMDTTESQDTGVEQSDENKEQEVPPPEAVEPTCPFTAEDTLEMHAAAHKPQLTNSSDSASMIVHTEDETPSEWAGMETSTTEQTERAEGGTEDVGDVGEEEKKESETGSDQQEESEKVDEEQEESKTEEQKEEETEEKAEETDEKTEEKPKEKETKAPTSSGKNLWVSGLSTSTRAADLKSLFSKHGRVGVAKIITSTKAPGSRCFGFVSLSSAEEAAKCIQHLHRTELKGRMIHVERTVDDSVPPSFHHQPQRGARRIGAAAAKAVTAKKDEKKEGVKGKPKALIDLTTEEKDKEKEGKKETKKSPATRSKHSRDRSRHRESPRPRRHHELPRRPPAPYHHRRIMAPMGGGSYYRRPQYSNTRHMAGRLLTRSRINPPMRREDMRRPPPPLMSELSRDRERRDLEALMRRKEEEHKQKEEKLKIEKEKERLRFEREKLEREKLELQQLRMAQQAPAPLLISTYGSSAGASARRSLDTSQYYGSSGGTVAVDEHRRRHTMIERERRHEPSGREREHRSHQRTPPRRESRSDRGRMAISERREDRYSNTRERERSHQRPSAYATSASSGYGSSQRMSSGAATRAPAVYGSTGSGTNQRREFGNYYSTQTQRTLGSNYTGGTNWQSNSQANTAGWTGRQQTTSVGQLSGVWGSMQATPNYGSAGDRFDGYKYSQNRRGY